MSNILASLPVKRVTPELLLAFSQRSFLDHSGNGLHAVPGVGPGWIRQRGVYGYYPNGANSRLVVPDAPGIRGQARMTWFWWGDYDAIRSGNAMVCSKSNGALTDYDLYNDLTWFYLWTPAGAPVTPIANFVGRRSFAITAVSGAVPKLYLDGAFFANFNVVVTLAGNAVDLHIGNYSSGDYSWRNRLSGFAMWSDVLTADEISSCHTWSDSLSSPTISPNRRYFDRGSWVANGSAGGEVASFDLGAIHSGTCADRSGNGNHGTVVGAVSPVPTEVGRAASFDGVTGEITIADDPSLDNYTDQLTIEGLIRYDALTDTAPLLHREGAFSIHTDGAGLAYATFGTSGKAWAVTSKSAAAVFMAGLWHHVALVYEDGVGVKVYVDGVLAVTDATFTGTILKPAAGLYLGRYGAAGARLNGAMQFVGLVNQAWGAGEVKSRADRIARTCLYYEDMSRALPTVTPIVAGQQIPGTEYEVYDGTFSVVEGVVGGVTRKWIECVTDGLFWRWSRAAYGTWDFEWSKESISNMRIGVIKSDVPNAVGTGYFWILGSSQLMQLYELGVGIKFTAGAFTAAVPNTLRLTREPSAGQFYGYIKGGMWDAWHEVGDQDDNTTTTSRYVSFEMQTGDKLFLDAHYLGPVLPG